MIEFVETPDDTLALKITGRITGDDLDPIMDRLDAAMAKHDKVHVYVETHAISSLELAALPHYWSRAFPLLGKLNRFGRVAVVTDQTWIRLGTKIESAMLPFISYRTFDPEERDTALDWVVSGVEA